jgi:GH15 family glucan-1,4-alpha-glucosidase
MLPADNPRVTASMKHLRERLWVQTDIGGLARYENDQYERRSEDLSKVPGNPWFICTLWLAHWHITAAKTLEDLEPASELLQWVAKHALPSGILAEQLHPYTGEPLSVSPLTWSHASVVFTVQALLTKREQLTPAQ